MATATPDIVEAEVPAVLQAMGGGEIDVQISTAKRFPRSIASFKKVALEMACLDEETAEACFYALPRDGKTVEGPSARLAEICASAWGNLRVEARQVGEDERFVTSRGTAWDLQTNVAIAYEVKRRITTSSRNGQQSKKYSDDMVGVTSNAASSIALRNAVFKVIPAAFWKPIYVACRHVAVGDIKTLANRRAAMLDHFQKMGVTNEQVFGMLDVKGADDITLDHLVTLKGLATALKDGETTIEEAFANVQTPIKPAERKSEQAAKTAPAPEPSQAPEPRTVTESTGKPGTVGETATSGTALNIGVIVKINPTSGGAFIHLDTGYVCASRNDEMIKAAERLRDEKKRIELVANKPKDSKFAPTLTAIEPVDDGAQS